jgi:hypothetical protein
VQYRPAYKRTTIKMEIKEMSLCILCGKEAEQIEPKLAYYHYKCRFCGEYKITLQAATLIGNKEYNQSKYIISSIIFNNQINKNDVFTVTTDTLKEIYNTKETNVKNKIYRLSMYCYKITKDKGLGNEIEDIPNQCCYANDNNELFTLLDYLKEMQIITFTKDTQSSAAKILCSIISNIKLTTNAYILFDNGINSLEDFERLFMTDKEKDKSIFINNRDGNLIFGSNNTQIISEQGITESEIIKILLNRNIEIDIIDKIREDIKELSIEINKAKIDIDKVTSIFQRIKSIGGKAILVALSFINKPEFAAIVNKIIQ